MKGIQDYYPDHFGQCYGGLLVSLIDCHGTGSAALALAKEKGIELKGYNASRCVTGSLQVSYKKLTPIYSDLEIRGVIKEVKGKKVTVDIRLLSKGEVCVTGEVVAI
jgi:acyl-CoA thioesterase FadM